MGMSYLHPQNKSLLYCTGFAQPDGSRSTWHCSQLVQPPSAPLTLVLECKMSSSRYLVLHQRPEGKGEKNNNLYVISSIEGLPNGAV